MSAILSYVVPVTANILTDRDRHLINLGVHPHDWHMSVLSYETS